MAKELKGFFEGMLDEYTNSQAFARPLLMDIIEDGKAEIKLREGDISKSQSLAERYSYLGEKAKERFSEWQEDVRRRMKEEHEIVSAVKHIEAISAHLRSHMKNMEIQLRAMIKDIEDYIYLMGNSNPFERRFVNDISIAENDIEIKSKQLYELLKEEKESIIDPISKFAKVQKSSSERAKDLLSTRNKGFLGFWGRKKVEIEDIKSDLMAFTRPDEVQRYLLILKDSGELLSESAVRYVGSLLTLSLQRIRLLHHRSKLAEIDELTRAKNRREANIRIEHEFMIVKRYLYELIRGGRGQKEQFFSVIFFDIDDFGRFNKTYGHEAGDVVLITIVNAIGEVLRQGKDTLYRYGGEEFCIVLSDTDIDGGAVVGEKIRSRLASTGNEFINRETGYKENRKITLSIGVAESREIIPDGQIGDAAGMERLLEKEPFKLREDIIKLADKRMQNSKKTGKDRVTKAGFLN